MKEFSEATKEQQDAIENIFDSMFLNQTFPDRKAITGSGKLGEFRRRVHELSRKQRWKENISTARWLARHRLKNHKERIETRARKGNLPKSATINLEDDDDEDDGLSLPLCRTRSPPLLLPPPPPLLLKQPSSYTNQSLALPSKKERGNSR